MDFNILDLFCGAGGLSNGLEKNKNFKTVLAVDFDSNAAETFKKNFKNTEILVGDITKKNIKDMIIQKSKEKKVNMIVGGPPCQGFSLKGKNLGLNDPRNFLFIEFIEIVEKLQPEIIIIENVKNMFYSCNGFFIKEIEKKFNKLGYILNCDVLNAKDYGVPQNRERTIIIGSKSNIISFPEKKSKIVTVKDAIFDLAYLNSGEGKNESEYKQLPNSDFQFCARKGSKKLFNHIATNHSKIALKKLSLIPPEGDKNSLPKQMWGKQKFSTTWSRLKWNEVSPTIDTRFDTPSNGRNSHPFLNRAITPREAARLQSFSDDFIFLGNKTSICRQIGNAVPPLLSYEIGKEINKVYNRKNIDENNTKYELYNKDSNLFIKELIKNKIKVNHIITDPPYKISKENNFDTLKNRKGIYFGNWDEKFDLYNWIPNYLKILKENGSIIIFCSYLEISNISRILKENGTTVKDILIWKKTNPMPRNVERRYVQDLEFAIWSVKNKSKWVFNKPANKPYLRSIFEYPVVSGKERTMHPTQKSLKLMEDIIKIHTNPNDIIIDPFMGSGTTGVACIKNKRFFIGIEKEKNYFNIAKNRIKENQV
ncbi:DNA (cytosine-5-)-methyltransferase [Mesomycoplasma moatsii]|uniref:DNA (cytosine-5-)-methyltransferase n=1 Tax=Mesomycoplasma moatsii TaxID=171287 RepID=UPI0003B6A57C